MAVRSRSKEAVFLVLAVTTLVTAIFTFRGSPAAGPATQTTSWQPARGSRSEERAGGLGLSDPMKVMPAANGVRNPFAAPPGTPPEALVMDPLPGAGELRPQAPAQTVAPVPATPPPTTLPTFVTATPPPQTIPLQPAGVTAPPPSNKPSLSGIVADSSGKPTAIIHEGDQRYFAKAGDTVAGKYRVQSIGNQQVVLVAARERLILKMGGS